jgi:ParB family chromosome partitioning protein
MAENSAVKNTFIENRVFNFDLIAGERRLRALNLLGYKQIEVRVMSVKDAEHQLNLEISENETRKDFSKKERIDYARRLERIESVKADKRQQATLKQNQNTDVENFPPRQEGKVRDIVAEKLNIGSGKQYEKEKYIVDNADADTLEQWDKQDISTHKAYKFI